MQFVVASKLEWIFKERLETDTQRKEHGEDVHFGFDIFKSY